MIAVTAKELKSRLGQYLHAVEAGETVRVTMRGRPVAEIKPLATTSHEKLAQLVREGLVTPGSGGRIQPVTPIEAKCSATDILLAEREEMDGHKGP